MLDIDMEFKQGILIVRLKGVLNGDTSNLLKSDMEMVIKNNGIKYVLLNLKNLSFIDEYGFEIIKCVDCTELNMSHMAGDSPAICGNTLSVDQISFLGMIKEVCTWA